MARVISASAQKGGVGKTTLSVQAALVTAIHLNKRTLLIDVDPQCNSSGVIITPEQKEASPQSVASRLYMKDATVTPIKGKYGIDVIPGDDGINAFPQELSNGAFASIIQRLAGENSPSANDIIKEVVDVQLISFAENVERLRQDYDYIFIDTPPSFLGLPLISALCASTDVIGLVEPNNFSSQVIEGFIEKVSQIHEQYNPELKFHGFIINKLRATSARHNERAEQWMKEFPDFFLGKPIKTNSWLEETTEDGEPCWKNANNSHRRSGAKNLLDALSDVIPEIRGTK